MAQLSKLIGIILLAANLLKILFYKLQETKENSVVWRDKFV